MHQAPASVIQHARQDLKHQLLRQLLGQAVEHEQHSP